MYVAAMDYIRDLLYQAYSHHLLHSSPFRFHVPLGLCSQAQMQELGATWGIAHEGDQWYHVHVESKVRMRCGARAGVGGWSFNGGQRRGGGQSVGGGGLGGSQLRVGPRNFPH